MGPDSSQWCPATGQGATGTHWTIGSSTWTWRRTSSLWGWWSTGIGCPEGLWILLLWRYSRPAWMWSCAVCSRWPFFGGRVGLDDPQRSLLTPTILWFCDSVIVWFYDSVNRPGDDLSLVKNGGKQLVSCSERKARDWLSFQESISFPWQVWD